MSGIRRRAKIQMGDENTKGTATQASMIWRGPASFFDDEEVPVFVEEDVGRYSQQARTFIPKVGAVLDQPAMAATFAQLPYILMAGVEKVASIASGSGFTWTYEFGWGVTAQTTLTYTVEAGDNQKAFEASYCFVEEFVVSGAAEGMLQVSARWRGQQVASAEFTGSISLPAVEEIAFNKGVLSIDASGGSIGGNPVSTTFISMEFRANTGLVPKWTGDGELYFSASKFVGADITLAITFEYDGTATAEEVACKAETGRLIRMNWTGSTLGTDAARRFRIDMAGKWASFDVIGEQNGNDIVRGNFNVREIFTDGLYCEISLCNALTTLP